MGDASKMYVSRWFDGTTDVTSTRPVITRQNTAEKETEKQVHTAPSGDQIPKLDLAFQVRGSFHINPQPNP